MLWRRHRTPRTRHAARGRIEIAIEKALDVSAPLRRVFGACSGVERLPELMPHLREARPVAVDHHHWTMDDTAGPPIEWDTVVTKYGCDRCIEWETAPGSVIRHSGRLTFRRNDDGSTRVTVGLSYVLPPGHFGERVAALVGAEDLDESLRSWRARVEGRSVRSPA